MSFQKYRCFLKTLLNLNMVYVAKPCESSHFKAACHGSGRVIFIFQLHSLMYLCLQQNPKDTDPVAKSPIMSQLPLNDNPGFLWLAHCLKRSE